jgi:hypothetical protein
MEETEAQCIEQARLSAIAREFGTTVSETSVNRTTDSNGQVDNTFHFLTRTSVLGEWIEDKEKPQVVWQCEGDRMNVTANVRGLIRMLPKEGKAEVKFYACSPGDPARSKSDFRQDETLNAVFQSSSSGFLSVYYVDHTSRTVQRLFPAASMATANHLAVQADRQYQLLNRNTAAKYDWQQATKEKTVNVPYCSTSSIDELVAVFSTVEYIKPSLEPNAEFEELSEEAFDSWLNELKGRQKQCVVKRSIVLIGNN